MQIEYSELELQELKTTRTGGVGKRGPEKQVRKEEMSVDLGWTVQNLATLVSFSYNLKNGGWGDLHETGLTWRVYWGKGLDRGRERLKDLPASLGELGKRERNRRSSLLKGA